MCEYCDETKKSTCRLGVTIFTAKSLLPLENWGLAK